MELLGQPLVAALQAMLEQIGHSRQLDRPAGGGQGIPHGAGATSAAADQGQPDGRIFNRMHARHGHAGQRRGTNGEAGALQEASSARSGARNWNWW